MKEPRYETIRAAYIAWAMLVNTAVIYIGLSNLSALNATSNAFLLFVLGMLNIPVAFYYHDRWATEMVRTLQGKVDDLKVTVENKDQAIRSYKRIQP